MADDIPTAQVICAQCGAEFTIPRKRNWHNRKLCGPECAAAFKRAYRPEYLRRFAKRSLSCVEDGTKVCRDCRAEKPVTDFHKSTNYKDGRQNRCGECTLAYGAKIHAKETPEHRRERLDRKNERARVYYAANPHKKAEYTRRTTAQNTERHRKWREQNRERFRAILSASNYKRRQLVKGGMTGLQTKAWFDAQKKVCHWCGKKCADLPTIDHVIPLARGGMHEARNLVIACKPCNSRKHAKDPIEFARELGKLL